METNRVPDLFSEEPSDKLCVTCGLGLEGEVINNTDIGGEAHVHCVAEHVSAGDIGADQAIEMEKAAGLKTHPLLAAHPSVIASGCVACSKPLFADDLVIVSKNEGDISAAHQVCIGSLVGSAGSPAILVSLARMNDMGWDSLLSYPAECKSCQSQLLHNPVVVAQDLYHEGCLAAEMNRGLKVDLKSVASNNGITAIALQNKLSSWKRAFDAVALKREAAGMVSDLWNRFKSWVSDMYQSLTGADEAYDAGISAAEQMSELAAEGAIIATGEMVKQGIDPDVQKAMDLLLELEKAEKEREDKLASIMTRYAASNLKNAKSEAAGKVKEYLESLSSKQRKYSEALFRLKEVKHRGTFDSTSFRAGLRQIFQADAAMTARINQLEVASTKASFTSKEVEVLQSEPEVSPEISTEAPAAPAAQPTRRSSLESLFDDGE